jgi:three-Cys-motif partner protein
MKPPEYYKGREQTYLKHYVLDQYLETVALHIGYAQKEFAYVDCFSGPWRNESDDLADTSIRIALDKLNYVRNTLALHERHPTIRAIFIEKDTVPFDALQQALEAHRGSVQTTALPGTFEGNVPAILKAIGSRFAFCFIDPTGWTGLAMDRIAPLLRHQPGEVMINFMYDFINRFLNSHDPRIEASLDDFFGTNLWRELRDHPNREIAIINLYAEQVRAIGEFPYVTSTKILKPLHERAYFHLIYATRSSKGIEKFRDVEKRLMTAQARVRTSAQRRHREERSRQTEISFSDPSTFSPTVADERGAQRTKAIALVRELLGHGPLRYEQLLPVVLQIPLFWKTDLHDLLTTEQKAGRIVIEGMTARQRVPKKGCLIRLI